MRLLVTRPEPDGARSAARLRGRGHEVLHEALLRIEHLGDAALTGGPFAALVFTSANGVHALKAHRDCAHVAGLPVYAVGKRTQAAAAAAGFAPVASADGDVGALAALIAARHPPGGPPLLYGAGEDRAGDLEGALEAHGIRVATRRLYRAAAAADLSPAVAAALAGGAIEAVLHYSARTAAAFLAAAAAAGVLDASLQVRHLCLSARVAAPLAAAGARAVGVAGAPTEEALFALLSPPDTAPPDPAGPVKPRLPPPQAAPDRKAQS